MQVLFNENSAVFQVFVGGHLEAEFTTEHEALLWVEEQEEV